MIELNVKNTLGVLAQFLKDSSLVSVAALSIWASGAGLGFGETRGLPACGELIAIEECPFCEAINMTFAERFKINDIVVIGEMVDEAPPSEGIEAATPKGKFAVKRIFKGHNFIGVGTEFFAPIVAAGAVGDEFLCFGIGPPLVLWDEVIPSHERVEKYLDAIQTLPEKGPERLAFFQDYFEDDLVVLAMDAYDEFAISSYEDLQGMREQMDRPRLLKLIQAPGIDVGRRRLYLTMLGVCGQADEDLPMLERLLLSDSKEDLAGLDALSACYLSLKGAEGLTFIEERFLLNEQMDYVATQEVVSALRFHGTEAKIIPKERLIETVRKLLFRPRLADLVIPDLARWEDWSVMPQLVKLFKDSDRKPNWVRVPILQYLQACPLDQAKVFIEELKEIDPDAFRRATFYSNLDFDDDD
jgi:hypothetical protein